ncbi:MULTISPECIES: gp16 family protein [Klebsiella]|uniref:gp16 family protein n=1 Tax=Klebsiella/Raoultella group TaxID=2890311 RepID=UPI0039C87EA8
MPVDIDCVMFADLVGSGCLVAGQLQDIDDFVPAENTFFVQSNKYIPRHSEGCDIKWNFFVIGWHFHFLINLNNGGGVAAPPFFGGTSMSRTSMIKVIHIARRDLHLDDDTYRALLGTAVPGKTSCSDMTVNELQNVIQALEAKGFKSKPQRRSKRRMSAPSDVSLKIRAIWKTMFNEGFIRDGSDIALDRFVRRQTRIRNGGAGVSSLEWLRGDAEANFLESLKQWHIRAMRESMLAHHVRLPENPVTGEESRDYDTICSAYADAARRWIK